ncbi:MAG: hypothetical protein CMN21_24730 [Rubinisphaera sp.]|nr:hypothetical protein [Rubinisphaera sp.]
MIASENAGAWRSISKSMYLDFAGKLAAVKDFVANEEETLVELIVEDVVSSKAPIALTIRNVIVPFPPTRLVRK